MTKSYSLADILKHAAVNEDVERQAQDIEKKGQAEEVKKVYQQKKPKGNTIFPTKKSEPQKARDKKYSPEVVAECSFCGKKHVADRAKCPASWQGNK